MYAHEARRQQALMELQELFQEEENPRYPSNFWNRNNEVNLSIPPKETAKGPVWHHQPLIPGQNEPWRERKQSAGMVRAVFTPGNPTNFEVIHHDPSKGYTTNKWGKKTAKFGISRYYPAVEAQSNQQQQQQ